MDDGEMETLDGYELGSSQMHSTTKFSVMRHGHPTDAPARHVSVKSVMRKHPLFVEADVRREIAILEKIRHPQCAVLLEVKEDAACLHVVEEIGAGGEMLDRIVELGSFSETDAVHLIHQVPACPCAGTGAQRRGWRAPSLPSVSRTCARAPRPRFPLPASLPQHRRRAGSDG